MDKAETPKTGWEEPPRSTAPREVSSKGACTVNCITGDEANFDLGSVGRGGELDCRLGGRPFFSRSRILREQASRQQRQQEKLVHDISFLDSGMVISLWIFRSRISSRTVSAAASGVTSNRSKGPGSCPPGW